MRVVIHRKVVKYTNSNLRLSNIKEVSKLKE